MIKSSYVGACIWFFCAIGVIAGAATQGHAAGRMTFDVPENFPDPAYAVVSSARCIWFGEVHGTQEMPRLFIGLVKLVAKHDVPPVVALELPTSDTEGINEYLRSGDVETLRNRTLFGSSVKDGRSSEAMKQILDELRPISVAAVYCFDPINFSDGQDRELKMAENLGRFAARYPNNKLLVLSGNIHSRAAVGAPWDPSYRPAAFVLSEQLPSLIAFQLTHGGGTARYMSSDGYKDRTLRGRPYAIPASHFIQVHPELANGHHGEVFSARILASPPW